MSENHIPVPIEVEQIMTMIPHRYPFLLIDRVIDYQLEPEIKITAIKNVTLNEPFFQGHFPNHPVMPGVLIIEALAQAAGVLAYLARSAKSVGHDSIYYLVKVDKARFSKTVVPGDQLTLDVVQKRLVRGMAQYECKALVDGKRVASAEILCAGRGG